MVLARSCLSSSEASSPLVLQIFEPHCRCLGSKALSKGFQIVASGGSCRAAGGKMVLVRSCLSSSEASSPLVLQIFEPHCRCLGSKALSKGFQIVASGGSCRAAGCKMVLVRFCLSRSEASSPLVLQIFEPHCRCLGSKALSKGFQIVASGGSCREHPDCRRAP